MQGTAAADRAPRRNFGLDVLRCAAILIVLVNHAFIGFFLGLGGAAWDERNGAASLVSFVSIEWLFVLSGFLIGTMMIRSFDTAGTFWSRARSFWLRRWFRTFPNYYLFLVVNIAIVAWGLHGVHLVGPFTWEYAVFSQNVVDAESVPFFYNEAWSLALDEWFYLVLPLLVGLGIWAARRKTRDAFLAATAALILVPTILRVLVPIPADPLEWDLRIRRVTLFHLDATGWGVLAAIANRWTPAFWTRGVVPKAVAGFILMGIGVLSVQAMMGFLPQGATAVFMAWPRFPFAFALTCTGLGTFLALPAIARLRPPGTRSRKAVETVSNYTYSIYLSHFPLIFLLGEAVARTWGETVVPGRILWPLTILWFLLVFGVSAVVYHVFEKPTSDLRERFTRKIDASPFGPAPPP